MTVHELKYLFLIFIVFIAACIETDIYLPAFPDMMIYFSVSEEAIQKLLTWNFIGICLSCPFYGPISDAIGRKKPLLVALGLFLVGSLMTLLSDSFAVMLWGRFLQGLGSGGCFTLGTAIIFDAFEGDKAVRATNKLNSSIPFIMAGAPLLGGYLNQAYDFRANFVAIAVFVLISLVISAFFFEETLPQEKRSPLSVDKMTSDFKRVFCCLPFWQVTVVVSVLIGGYIAFLSGSTLLFVGEMGVSKQALPLFQAALLGSWLVASLTFTRAIKRWGTGAVKRTGITITVVSGAALALAAFLMPEDPYLVTSTMFLYVFGVNWAQSLYFPEGMQLLPDIKGITASVLTSARLFLTALIVGITSSCYDSTIYPLAVMIVSIILICLPLVLFYEKRRNEVLIG